MKHYNIIKESLINGQKKQAAQQFYDLHENQRLDVIEAIKEQGDLELATLLLKFTYLT